MAYMDNASRSNPHDRDGVLRFLYEQRKEMESITNRLPPNDDELREAGGAAKQAFGTSLNLLDAVLRSLEDSDVNGPYIVAGIYQEALNNVLARTGVLKQIVGTRLSRNITEVPQSVADRLEVLAVQVMNFRTGLPERLEERRRQEADTRVTAAPPTALGRERV